MNAIRREAIGHVAALAVITSIVLASCATDSAEFVAGAGDLGHIHDMALDEEGVLLVASHSGLYRIEDASRAIRIGVVHDLMSMAVLSDGNILASGHPNLLLDEFRVEGRPAFLGLARSTDGGETWEDLDLLGEADFHALVPTGEGLYAAETTGRIWFQDYAGEWTTLGAVEARDLAIDPTDSRRQLAPDYDGALWASADGGASWTTVTGAPALIEVEWTEATLVGVTEPGAIWSTATATGPWSEIARGPADVETLYVDDSGSWWVSVHGGEISRTDDQGETWATVYVPPDLD